MELCECGELTQQLKVLSIGVTPQHPRVTLPEPLLRLRDLEITEQTTPLEEITLPQVTPPGEDYGGEPGEH